MKALVKTTKGPGLTLQEVPEPKILADEVLIKIKSNAICGTDLHIYDWDEWAQKTVPTPLVIGHEFMGEIVKVGALVNHLKVGLRVTAEGHITCGYCHNCRGNLRHLCPNAKGIGVQRDGAFAEYLAIPASNVIPIPTLIRDDVATILDPLGNAVHSALAFDLIGEEVLVTGAGPIGLMAIKIATFTGAKFILATDVNDFRLELALLMGAHAAVNVHNQTLENYLTLGDKTHEFTIGLEMSGHEEAIKTQLNSLYPGSNLAMLGIPSKPIRLELNKIIFKGLTLKGIYGRKMFQTWEKMIAMIETGLDVSKVITHHFNITEFEQAFKLLKKGEAGKILLHW